MEFSLAQALATKPVCQQRTSGRKQFVFLDGEFVIKGPYERKNLELLFLRAQTLAAWHTPLVLLPLPEILHTADGLFIRYPNLARDYVIEAIEPHQESFSSFCYFIAKRTGILRLSDYLHDHLAEANWVWQQMLPLLIAHIDCFALAIGDRGLYNILVDPRKQTIHIIDMDESRGGGNETSEFFYFSKTLAKGLAPIWLEHARPLYPQLIQHCQQRHAAEPATKWLNVIALLQQFLASGNGPAVAANGTHMIVAANVATDQAPLPGQGQMHWGGLFAGTHTVSGLALDVAKSALQKYIRRASANDSITFSQPCFNMTEKALLAAVELYRLAEVGGKAGQTNLYHRLAIIAAEDIGPANLPVVQLVLELLEADRRDPAELMAIVAALAGSRKTRLMSQLWRTYTDPKIRDYAASKGINVRTTADAQAASTILPAGFWQPADPVTTIKLPLEMFALQLRLRDPNCIYWLGQYLHVSEGLKVVARSRRTKPLILIWLVLAAYLPPKLAEVLQYFSLTLSEFRPFVMAAVTAILVQGATDGGNAAITYEVPSAQLQQNIEQWRNSTLPQQLFAGQAHLQVDDFCIDKHTGEGKRAGKDRQTFVHEGAMIVNEDPAFNYPVYQDIYRQV